MILLTDKQLTTEEQVVERMASIKRKREQWAQGPSGNKAEHINSFNNRQHSIARLTERLDNLSHILKTLRRAIP